MFFSVDMAASGIKVLARTQGTFRGQTSLQDRLTRRIGLVDYRSILGFDFSFGQERRQEKSRPASEESSSGNCVNPSSGLMEDSRVDLIP